MTDPDRITPTTTRPADYRPAIDDLVLCTAASIGDDVPRLGLITSATDAAGRPVVDCGRHGIHAAAAVEYVDRLPPASADQSAGQRMAAFLAADLLPLDLASLGTAPPHDVSFAGDLPDENAGKKRSKRETPAKRKVCDEK